MVMKFDFIRNIQSKNAVKAKMLGFRICLTRKPEKLHYWTPEGPFNEKLIQTRHNLKSEGYA